MAPPSATRDLAADDAPAEAPPSKRVRFSTPDDDAPAAAIAPHPLRLKPSGNALTAAFNRRDVSTGRFGVFPDELLLAVLGYLGAAELCTLGRASRGLYAFCRSDELWKALFIESEMSREDFVWRGTWRRTLLRLPAEQEAVIHTPDLYSDALYRPYHMSQVPLEPFTRIRPENEIVRLPDLTPEEYDQSYADTPFILTEPVKSWPGYGAWSVDSLLAQYADVPFRAEAVDWRLRTYVAYMRDTADESPLYLFDRAFAAKTAMGGGFAPPACFSTDYFGALGAERPDHRWLIAGPARSGSSFHKDPNATCAWNGVVAGAKYWIMFPPGVQPPGVFVSADLSEVTAPLSIAEWLVGFHAAAVRIKGCVEGVCRAGEVLHVPSGWWHLVVNLTEAVALTQNFVPRTQLPAAIEFLRDQPKSVSGFDCHKVKDPYELFVRRMRETHPEELDEALAVLERKGKKRSRWDDLVGTGDDGSFTFGFGGDDSDEDQ